MKLFNSAMLAGQWAWDLPESSPLPNAEGNREELQPAIYMGNGVLNSVEKNENEEMENGSRLLSLVKKMEHNEWLLSCGRKTRANGLCANTADTLPSKSSP